MAMITVQPRREEAIRAGFKALGDRLPSGYSYDQMHQALQDWDVKAFCNGDDVVGMLMVKDSELHVAVLPEVRGRWLSRKLIRDVIGPLVKQYGEAKTKVMEDNLIGQEFVRRIGFAATERDNLLLLREGFEQKYFDPTTALIGAGVGLLSGAMQSNAASDAAGQAASAANNATATNQAMFDTTNAQQAPWRQAGQTALGQIADMQPQFTHSFNASDLNANMAPNYQFQLDQGLGAVKNAGNLQTGLVSGNTMKGINDYAQNYASGAYQNAFNNYSANQTNIFNRLSNIAGLGQTANANVGTVGATTAGNAGNAQQAAGAAQAAGTVGSANAVTGGLNNALGWYSLPQMMNYGGGSGIPSSTVANLQSFSQ